jgi:hypothetical protein
MRKTTLIGLALLALCAIAASVARAQSPHAALANKLPGGANAVLVINVEKFVASPLGQAQELQARLMSGYADRPLAVPATARRVAIGAAVHPVGMRAIWEAAIIELSGTPRLEPMLQAQGGYLDKIEGRPTAWTPRDTFYIALDDKTLAVARPAQRQLVRGWLLGKDRPSLAPYFTTAMTAAGDADAVFIVDLDDVIGAPALRYAYGMGRLPSLEKIEGGAEAEDKLIQALASVRGMSIAMRVTDKISAQWIIDFEQPVAALGDQVEPFIIDVMTAADLYEPGVEDQWTFKAEGKRIVGTGTMQLAGLNKLIGLLSPINVGDAEATAGDGEAAPAKSQTPAGAPAPPPAPPPADGQAPPSTDPKQRAAAASQSYYRAVAKKLDMMTMKPSPSQGATWLIAQARQIEQLPLLDVDPALAEWGASVSNAFYRAAEELGIGQQRAQIASERIASPTASVAWTESGQGSSDTAESRANFRNAQKQRREAAQNERSQAAERAFNVFNEILPTRQKIRAEMVQKYGVEF